MKKYILGIFLISFFISCQNISRDEYHKSFDLPLITKSEELLSSGDYKGFMTIQEKYYKIANKKSYQDGKAICYLNLFRINCAMDNLKNALYFLNKAESILISSKDSLHKAMLYNAYATYGFYFNINNLALDYNNKSINILKKEKDRMHDYLLSNAYKDRGLIFYNKSSYDSSFVYFRKSEALISDPFIPCFIAGHYIKYNKLDSAMIYIQRAQNIIRRKKNSNLNMYIFYIAKGNYFSRTHNYQEAEKEYLKALEVSEKLSQVHGPPLEVYQRLADLNKVMGNKGLAYYYIDKYNNLSLNLKKEYRQNVNSAVNKFINDIKENNEKKKKNMIVLITILISISLIISIIAYRKIKKLQLNKKLLKNEAEELKDRIDDRKYNEVVALGRSNDSTFLTKFKDLYPDFIPKLLAINPNLENSELAFCCMIKLNFNSKEIATYTFVLPTSVDQRKRRLRKRLNIPNATNLYRFFNDL
ncbi:hypothetical protein [Elizabethkingia ursingii]